MPDPSGPGILLQILLLIFLTALNAFFSASEMALVSLSHSRVEQRAEEGSKAYQNLLRVIDNPTHFLSTVQVGITFLNIVAGASLADSLARELSPVFGKSDFAHGLATVIILVVLTFFTIVFGELLPKTVAQALKEKAALRLVRPLQAVGHVLAPFIWLLTVTINGLKHLVPIRFDEADDSMSRDEIEYLVSTEDTELEEDEREMLSGVLSLDTLLAREIMVPRTDTFMIDIHDDAHENVEKILKEAYSRVPVYEDDKDKILGVLHTKRLLKYGFEHGFEDVDIRGMLHDALFVPETINVDDLITELRKTHNQMAILLNEYGGVEGIVTLEDMIEEIVGEIEDESDIEVKDFAKLSETTYVVLGKVTLNDFNEEFGTHLASDDVDTIAGFYLDLLGHIPEPKAQETVTYEDVENEERLTLTSLEIEDKRIVKLRVEFEEFADSGKEEEGD
ncbi:MAG: hemolysin family protein [Streptococcaceae bacterium]|jgi:putative hemolysin|nr:hemolysin family protein [Streptococcaceae bacterium]